MSYHLWSRAIPEDANIMTGATGDDQQVPGGMEISDAAVVAEEDDAGHVTKPAGHGPHHELTWDCRQHREERRHRHPAEDHINRRGHRPQFYPMREEKLGG